MADILHKSSILKKTIEVGSSTLMSRVLGIIREGLMLTYLGAGIGSDIFFTAFKIPNSLRKIFAEGALSAAFVPTLVQVVRGQGRQQANNLMSLAFIIFEGLVLALCALVMFKTEATLNLIAPGWSPDKIALAVPLLRILMPFIFFLSSSALLAGALQSVGHFFVPAFSPVLLNIIFITGLLVCWSYNLPVTQLCFFILFGGFVQCVGHIVAYYKLHFSFGWPNMQALQHFGSVFSKFLLGSISLSIVEINLFISTSFASYLPEGSISLIYYANRFMGIPLGVFAVAFSTILLPHFSRICSYAPKRLSFYLLETTKFVFWVTVPATFMLSFFADKLFSTLFLSAKFNVQQATEAGYILITFALGLFFFSINKILLNMYYALHATWIPAVISAVATMLNVGLNMAFISSLHATRLAMAITISGIVQTLLFVAMLKIKFNFKFYGTHFFIFVRRYVTQLALVFTGFLALYWSIEMLISTWAPLALKNFLLYKIGFWLWVGPLCGLAFLTLFYTRRLFKVTLYFLD